MKPEQVVKHFDSSISLVAYKLGYTEMAIRHWLKAGRIPKKAQQLIQLKTRGQLQAGVD